jgi:hypothetical protein
MTLHQPITAPKLNPSWPLRWKASKGTESQKAALISIALEAEKAGEDDIFAAAFDAATTKDPEERAEFIADLEECFAQVEREEAFRSAVYRFECRTGLSHETSL